MMRALLHRLIARFERRYAYDSTYMHAIAEDSPAAFLKFALAQGFLAHAAHLPPEARFAARFAATQHEDCGPCTQLVIDMALEEGISPALVRAVAHGEASRLPEIVMFALQYAQAVLAHTDTPELHAEVRARFGPAGAVTLAYAITGTRIYPMLKRALGQVGVCQRELVVDENRRSGFSPS
jgi:hypothetical protein